jgi:hypothetical protein
VDGVVFFVGWRGNRGQCGDAIIAVPRGASAGAPSRCSAFQSGVG